MAGEGKGKRRSQALIKVPAKVKTTRSEKQLGDTESKVHRDVKVNSFVGIA